MFLLSIARTHAAIMAPMLLLSSAALAQHSVPVAISDIAPTSQERTAVDVRISPDGAFIAYSATGVLGGTQTHSLFVRAADASAPAALVTTIQPSTTAPFFPNIPFTWRHVAGPGSTSKLVFGERTAAGGYDLKEFDPGTNISTTRTTFAPPAIATNILSLQLNPCRNLVSGVVSSFLGTTSSQSYVWHVNLNGGAPIFPSGATAIGQLIAVEMTPDETRGVYMGNTPTNKLVYQYSVAGGFPVQVANATAHPTIGGCLDNSRMFGVDSANGDLTAWGLPPIAATVPIQVNYPVGLGSAAASPNNLLAPGPKQFIAFTNLLNELRMTPTDYGGDIMVTGPPAGYTSFTAVSVDAAASKIAFIARNFGIRQVFVVSTMREVRATYLHPAGSSTVTFNATAPCNANEICVLAVSLGLTSNPVPFGPPGSGQIDLDSSAVSLGASFGAPLTVPPAVQVFNSSLVGMTLYYQAARLDISTGAFSNTTRAAGVTYF